MASIAGMAALSKTSQRAQAWPSAMRTALEWVMKKVALALTPCWAFQGKPLHPISAAGKVLAVFHLATAVLGSLISASLALLVATVAKVLALFHSAKVSLISSLD